MTTVRSRIRRFEYTLVGGTKAGGLPPEFECEEGKRPLVGVMPAIGFATGYAVFLVTAALCMAWPPAVADTIAGRAIPSNSRCMRASRLADGVVIELALGTPFRRVSLALRLDMVVDNIEEAVVVGNARTLESSSVRCTLEAQQDPLNRTVQFSRCVDVTTVREGSMNSRLESVLVSYNYVNAQTFSSPIYYGYVAGALGVEGIMYATRGYEYFVGNSYVCAAAIKSTQTNFAPVSFVGNVSDVPDNRDVRVGTHLRYAVETTVDQLSVASYAAVGYSPLHREFLSTNDIEGCVYGSPILMFPWSAANERMNLFIDSNVVAETAPETLEARRRLRELGIGMPTYDPSCIANVSSLNRLVHRFYTDILQNCPTPSSYGVDFCHYPNPTFPWRRVAKMQLRAHYASDDAVYVGIETDSTLDRIPGMTTTDDFVPAVVKLLMVILAAGVVWIRSDRVTSAPHWLFGHCIDTVMCKTDGRQHDPVVARNTVEDAFIGLLAIASRVAVSVWRLNSLAHDDQARVCIVELVGGAASMTSWILRFVVISPNLVTLAREGGDARAPLTRLGGSMALVDSSCAVLLSFGEPPIRVNGATGRFDDTARMLTGLLLSIVTLHRCVFAIACVSLMFEAHYIGLHKTNAGFAQVLLVSGVLWGVQVVSIGVALADLVVVPLIHLVERTAFASNTVVNIALFLALVNVGLPRLVYTATRLVR